jgi:hypothetical protein
VVKRRETDWSHRLPEEVVCVRCLRPTPAADLDRLLWCPECVEAARSRATRIGWTSGGVLAILLALYIWFGIQPDPGHIPQLWAATLAVAFYLGGRIARELSFGIMRLRNQQAVEATPSGVTPGSSPPAGE